MDEAFNASDRIWIAKSYSSALELDFLRSWSSLTRPSSEDDDDKAMIVDDDDNKAVIVAAPDPAPTGIGTQYFDTVQHKLWQEKDAIARTDAKRIAQLKQLLFMDDDEINTMIDQSKFDFDDVKRMPYVDKPVLTNGLMPILAPPIPHHVLEASQALSIYVNFASDPGEFQWKCKSVNEQISNSLDDALCTRKMIEADEKWDKSECREEFACQDDSIFRVIFYHQSATLTTHAKLKEPEMAVTVDILGSQTLKDLRSKFYCKNDHFGPEIEGNPFNTETPLVIPGICLQTMEANMDKPCGIFVGNTMYTNRASQTTQDYGQSLIQWCEIIGSSRTNKDQSKLGPFRKGSMEETKMTDLVFKQGFPYLFVHQGNCEHLVVIEKARIIHPNEHLLKASFPSIIKSNYRTLYCHVDNTRIARYAVRNTIWFPQDPMLLCADCLKLCFNNEQRVENFQLYHFLQISSLF